MIEIVLTDSEGASLTETPRSSHLIDGELPRSRVCEVIAEGRGAVNRDLMKCNPVNQNAASCENM